MAEPSQIRDTSPEAIEVAAQALRAGTLVAFPTETVYGLGADATSDTAVAGIFTAKGRPDFNPLIVHFTGREAAAAEVIFSETATALAEAFWPGPLTLVLPRRAESRISLLCSAGLDSLGVRAPAHPVAQALLAACDLPLAAPSANRSGRISPTTAAHVAASLGPKAPLVLDGGACPLGLESTVVDARGLVPRLLRPGGVTREQIEARIGPVEVGSAATPAEPRAPGQLASHYAPQLPLRLEAETAGPREALLAFGPAPPVGAALSLNLSPSADLTEAAARLFAALHELDRPGLEGIAVMPIPERGLGRAINDRLRRAAAPRDPGQS